MRISRLLVIIFSVLIVGITATMTYYYGFYLLEYHEIPVDFNVKQGLVGINTDSDALHMGGIGPGGYSRRRMTIEPAQDARLVIRVTGGAAPYVAPETNNLAVRAGEPLELMFVAAIPVNTTEGNYTGTAKFYFFRS